MVANPPLSVSVSKVAESMLCGVKGSCGGAVASVVALCHRSLEHAVLSALCRRYNIEQEEKLATETTVLVESYTVSQHNCYHKVH